jgi:hypothetical protein
MIAALAAVLALSAAPYVRTSVQPQTAFVGDPVQLQALVLAQDPDSVRVDARLAPFRELGRTSERDGDVVRVVITASCVVAACLDRVVTLPGPRVAADGIKRQRAWPPVRVSSRLPKKISGDPPWRLDDVRPPAVTYRVEPRVAELGLLVGSALLAVLGVVLLAGAARSRRPQRALTPLERALRAARDALRGDEAARRRALGALSRVVGATPLATRARAAAWAGEPPSREQVETLARAAEQEARR